MTDETKKVVVKAIDILDVYHEVQDVKVNQDLMCEKLDKYNGLHDRIDKMESRCKYNIYDEKGLYHRLEIKVDQAHDVLKSLEDVRQGKSILSNKIISIGLFIIAVIGGLSGLITLLRLFVTAL